MIALITYSYLQNLVVAVVGDGSGYRQRSEQQQPRVVTAPVLLSLEGGLKYIVFVCF